MTDAAVVRLMTKNLFVLPLLVGTVSPSFAASPPAPDGYHWVRACVLRKQTAAEKGPKVSIARLVWQRIGNPRNDALFTETVMTGDKVPLKGITLSHAMLRLALTIYFWRGRK